jgi:hypothetical protein
VNRRRIQEGRVSKSPLADLSKSVSIYFGNEDEGVKWLATPGESGRFGRVDLGLEG